jgi:biopolymer transport protein ExbD
MRKREDEYQTGNLVAMIDVVFQLIIFFVCTTNLQDKAIDDRIRLAMAPHGAPVTRKDPREINIAVDATGGISIARTPLTPGLLRTIVTKAVAEYGQDVPVVIWGDADCRHTAIRTAVKSCTDAGIYRIKLAAARETGR